MLDIAALAFCFLLAALLVWAFWPRKKQPPRVEAQRSGEPDWNWPT